MVCVGFRAQFSGNLCYTSAKNDQVNLYRALPESYAGHLGEMQQFGNLIVLSKLYYIYKIYMRRLYTEEQVYAPESLTSQQKASEELSHITHS